ncbi:MAG: hypothetical protein AVDCRST_MAG89-4442, partial [uncultured Gemmatimonadetes bacterium]
AEVHARGGQRDGVGGRGGRRGAVLRRRHGNGDRAGAGGPPVRPLLAGQHRRPARRGAGTFHRQGHRRRARGTGGGGERARPWHHLHPGAPGRL